MAISEHVRKSVLPFLLLVISGGIYVEECYAQKSGGRPVARKFDEYTIVSSAEESSRLARFAAQLKREPQAKAYIIGYNGRLALARESYRAQTASSTLGYYVAFNYEKIVTLDGGFREEPTTELYIVPRGASAPMPEPTVDANEVVQCPSIYIHGDREDVKGGSLLTFKASIADRTRSAQQTFAWTISDGKITQGQGTDSITVEVINPKHKRVAATVEIGGYSTECPNKASYTAAVGDEPFKFDEWGDIRSGDEKARLDNLAVNLQNNPSSRVHFIAYGRRRGRRGEVQARHDRMNNYLTNSRGLDSHRIINIDGGFREEFTVELWIVREGGRAPKATPTIDAKYALPVQARRRK